MWANKMGKIKENDSKCRYQQPCMAVSQVIFPFSGARLTPRCWIPDKISDTGLDPLTGRVTTQTRAFPHAPGIAEIGKYRSLSGFRATKCAVYRPLHVNVVRIHVQCRMVSNISGEAIACE